MSARPSLEAEIKKSQETGVLRVKKQPKQATTHSARGAPATSAPARRGLAPSTREEKKSEEEEEEAQDEGEDVDGGMIPQALSRKIMQQAQSQQKEEEEETLDDDDDSKQGNSAAFHLRDERGIRSFRDDDDDDEAEEDEEASELADEEGEELELTADDEASLSQFLPSSTATRRTLADLIMDKLNQHSSSPPSSSSTTPPLDPKVTAVYTSVATYLSHYTSGKIPKAFKIIPSLHNWEDVLHLTAPHQWTPQAVSAATRLFASNLNERMAQRFYSLVLLPRVRDNISEHQRLHYHLYQAMRRALFKPAAFFRGIVLPWCEDGLSVKESVILASLLAKYSLPPLHAAVCMLKLTEMEYSGPVMLVQKTLLNKKFSLPMRVLDVVSAWFAGFAKDERKMPLVWHQSLLVFVQRYGGQLTEEQAKRVRDVCRVQVHHLVTKDIRRELLRVREQRKEAKHAPLTTPSLTPPTPAPVMMES